MVIIEYHEGCRNIPGCMGPDEPYYTIFNTELRIIHYPLLLSLVPTATVFIIILLLKKIGVIKWSNKLIAVTLRVTYLLSFIFFANMSFVVY